MKDFEAARKKMVKRQIIARGISDPLVLKAMEEIPRHLFVDKALQREAYEDNPLPIGDGQTISQPYMVALMTELLELTGKERVLEIGTGSGYQAAVLSKLCKRVFTVERLPRLSEKAKRVLRSCGIENVSYKVGDGTQGWPSKAPFDAIIVTAGAPKIPDTLLDQLVDGGRLVIPIGDRYTQTLKRVIKTRSETKTENSTGCRFVDLIGIHGWSE
jgi:protein-L-isoaspartate(D-aspartate) O-methyltransferase